eukprot:758381-Hanusia_phi.AAC.6
MHFVQAQTAILERHFLLPRNFTQRRPTCHGAGFESSGWVELRVVDWKGGGKYVNDLITFHGIRVVYNVNLCGLRSDLSGSSNDLQRRVRSQAGKLERKYHRAAAHSFGGVRVSALSSREQRRGSAGRPLAGRAGPQAVPYGTSTVARAGVSDRHGTSDRAAN